MLKTFATVQQPAQPPAYKPGALLLDAFNPKIIFYLVLMGALLILLRIADSKQKVLGNARWANWFELRAARKEAINQMREKKSPKIAVGLGSTSSGNRLQVLFHTLAPGLNVVGASGLGKTESVISGLIDDFGEQFATLVIYDKKGDLTGAHAAYLMAMGYTVWVYPYDGMNLLKKMKGPEDVDGAAASIEALHANLGGRKKKAEDPFFGGTGRAALKTACLLAKGSVFPDFAMAFAFLSLPGFARRLAAGEDAGSIGLWTKLSSTGVRSISDAAQTIAGVIGSAVLNVGELMSPESVQSMIYDDIPIKLDGKQAVFFQVDKARKEISIPTIAAAIDLIVESSCNGSFKRESPFVLICDEKPTIALPNEHQWLAEYRSYWFLMVSAFQNEAQQLMHMEKYAKASNESNVTTKIYLEQNDWDSSKLISEKCGFTEAKTREGGHLRRHKVPLITANEVEHRGPGDAIIFTQNLKKVPWRVKFRLNKSDEKRRRKCNQIWETRLKPDYEKRSRDRLAACDIETELADRFAIADILLPTPEVIKAMQFAANPPQEQENGQP